MRFMYPQLTKDQLTDYGVKALGVVLIFLGGYYAGYSRANKPNERILAQLRGELSERDKAIMARDEKIGKIQTEILTEKKAKEELASNNQELSDRANEVSKKYNLLLVNYKHLEGAFNQTISGGHSVIPHHSDPSIPVCGHCSGAIVWGDGFASTEWADYSRLTTDQVPLNLHLRVRVDSVTMQQKDGAAQASLDRISLLSPTGINLGQVQLDPSSKSINVPDLRGNPYVRRYFAMAGADTRGYRIGLISQRDKIIYGAAYRRDFNGGNSGPEVFFGFLIH